MRVACEHLADAELAGDALHLLRQLAAAVGVFYNHTGDLGCLSFKQGPNPETGGLAGVGCAAAHVCSSAARGFGGGGRPLGRRSRLTPASERINTAQPGALTGLLGLLLH